MASSRPDNSRPPPGLRRIDELVLAAAALDPTDQEAFLRQATLTAPEVLAEVRRRLAAAASLPESFLAIPAAELLAAAARVEASLPPLPAGGARYQLAEQAGRGGMATVYRAFDRQLERPVALKLLDRTEPEARQRFLREAQAQARVRHDNVLEVYETGDLDGSPFIAMRWVAGPTLAGLRGETSLEQQVRLMAQVAEGLHAAHREGLIHRDVKPSNVLVEKTPDGDWKPWISDFGIAVQATGGPAALAGTPAYMAPELLRESAGAGAAADRRADVYSFGATLYELFAGRPPFDASDLPALLGQVRHQEPPPLRQLVPSLPPELAAIVGRCMEKDPEARYPSARAVALDLRRYLDGEVVEAHTASLVYRLTRFALRHRRLLTAAAAAAVLLVGALAVAAWLGVAARAANRRAELRRGQAEDLIAFMLTDLRDRLEPLGKLDILDEVGRRAMGYFAAVPRRELSDDELAHRSRALYQIGDVRIRQGKLPQALPPLEESLALAQTLASRDPRSHERLFGLGQSHFWVGYVHWEEGDLAAARPHFQTYRAISDRLVSLEPERADYRMELAYAESNLGSVARQAGDLAAALASFRRSLALKQDLVHRNPAKQDWRFELAAAHDLVGHTLMNMGHLEEARPHFDASLALRQELVDQSPARYKFRDFLGTSHDSLVIWWEDRGGIEEALAHDLAAQGIFTALTQHDPQNQLWRWKLELSRMKEGHLLALRGETRQGIARLAPLLRPVAEHAVREPADRRWQLLLAWTRIHLGAALLVTGDAAEARSQALQAVQGLRGVLARQPGDRDTTRWLATALVVLGRAESRKGASAAADAAWNQAAGLLAPAARQATDVDILAPWASALLLLGRRAEAGPALAALAASGYRQPELMDLVRAAGSPATAGSPAAGSRASAYPRSPTAADGALTRRKA
jgi:tetratricopeptide (TPR) repeat protein